MITHILITIPNHNDSKFSTNSGLNHIPITPYSYLIHISLISLTSEQISSKTKIFTHKNEFSNFEFRKVKFNPIAYR